jgi:hypothetical protein
VSDSEMAKSGNRYRRICLFKCHCGIKFKSTLSDVYNKRTSCGCRKGNIPNKYNQGDLINGVKFIKSCGTIKHAQRAIFECPICKSEWESLIGNIQAGNTKSCCGVKRGWSKSQWIKVSPVAKLYKVRLYNELESFIKIGITTKSIKKRFRNIPYDFEVIKIIESESGYIFDLENRIKRIFKNYKYKPLISFKGESECYNN